MNIFLYLPSSSFQGDQYTGSLKMAKTIIPALLSTCTCADHMIHCIKHFYLFVHRLYLHVKTKVLHFIHKLFFF